MKKGKKRLALTSLMLCGVMALTACGGAGGSSTGGNGGGNYLTEGTVSTTDVTSGYTEEKGKFYADYNTLDDAHEAGRDINVRLAEEGMVLLKNENGALPLTRDERYVTLLGVKSVDIQTGGGGSGNGNPGDSSNKAPNSYKIDPTTLEGSMKAAGFKLNEKVLDLYKTNIGDMSYEEFSPGSGSSQTLTHELPLSYYNDMITKTYRSYGDAAIITFSRSGAEGLDEIAHEDYHVLQLTEDEIALVKHAKANFKKVIVLVNTGNVIELGELNAPKTADNLGVDAILYVGHVGNDGAAAIGEILNGTVNPSGHTVDLWSADITKDPSYTNFGDMSQNGEGYDNYFYNGDSKTRYHSVEYREDIYVGYRYYETVAADMNAAKKGTGDEWYAENVVYPFGHGLSYTTFKWELGNDVAPSAKISAANQTVTMKVKVTNTGDMTGKDVVQIYVKQPYKKGGIEKAERVLVTYGKTKLLKPGQSETLTLKFAAQDMASFDWSDKNGNDFYGYEIESGNYEIIAARDSHTPVLSVKRTVDKTIKSETDLDTGKEITAVFSQTDGDYAEYNTTNESLINHLISRADGLKQPEPATKEDRTVNQAWVDMMTAYDTYSPVTDDADNPLWNINSVPSGWKQAASHSEDYSDVKIKIGEMSGVDYTNFTVKNGTLVQGTDDGSKKWEEFMNQLTWEELCQLASQGSYGRPSVMSVNMPFQLDIDGPSQLAWYGNNQGKNYYGKVSEEEAAMIAETANGMGTFWVGAVLIASTWNDELAEEQGVMVGNESLLTNTPGWYGPACNTHRSALGGRNFEYYSEDGVLGGKIVAAVIRGATSKGTVCFLKHMFLNDQETDRGGICTYATEQAIREIYLKPYEIALKQGRSLGTMGGGNRIGNRRVYNSYALYNGILRGEWDFKGMNITDSVAGGGHPDMDMMLRAGIDTPLGAGTPTASRPEARANDLEVGVYDAGANMVKIDGTASPTQWYIVRQAALHNLYATANSNGIDNGTTVTDQTVEFNGGMVNTFLVTPETFNCVAFSDVKVVEGELPEEVSLSPEGVISGVFHESNEYNIKVSMLVDGWISKTFNVKVVVKDSISYSGSLNATAGAAVNGSFTTTAFKVGETIWKDNVDIGAGIGMPGMLIGTVTGDCTAITYTSENLPEGLTLNADGTLSGSIASAGTYIFNVTANAAALYVYMGFVRVNFTQTFTQSFTITVA
ncbi:MAG: glycoside hydrolase family 3 C-terminal domain-containing protein [Clostridiales bacterium]|nr:glycoside hydrolase family 3 C-terminal domain-containing protein [Clostridiales bacterium]